MKTSNLYRNRCNNFIRNLFIFLSYFLLELFIATALLATMCGDGNKGLLELF